MAPGILVNGGDHHDLPVHQKYLKQSRKSFPYESLSFEPRLQPKKYTIAGTQSASKVLILDVNILDSTGKLPYKGDVYIEGERFRQVGTVSDVDHIRRDLSVRVIDGRGRTLMSGMGDAHTHMTWNNNALELLGNVSVEEHVLITAKSALCYLDSGYTMCYGAASAKDRLDVVIRDAINRGDIPGPRLLANGKEIAKREAELAAGITAYADGPMEMREVIRHHAGLGVDQVKLSMSGEAITETRSAEECFFSDEETAACVDEAHRNGMRVCAHARARDSVIQCVQHGVDVIYHASYTDEKGLDMLEKAKHRHVVAPAINWLYATVHEAEPFGYTFEKAEQVGYKKELEVACEALKKMHKRGVTILPGGDFGFAWCPHGTYARDLEHFVKLLDFTPLESIVAATAGVAKLFMQEHELGKILPGYYADCILVDGDPLKDIGILQKHDRLNVIMINGRIHKSSAADFVTYTEVADMEPQSHYNFITYRDEHGRQYVGHLDFEQSVVHELSMTSGSALHSLHEVIALGNEVSLTGTSVSLDKISILPPIDDRDILCVGNNYEEHVKEYKASGFNRQSKDTKATPPAIFTKRKRSIIASGADIYSNTKFTSTIDYEGEVAVIIGKPGFAIKAEDAMDYIWGYTILNDVTAREKQSDHGQFLMGKSPDTFCPMGPVAVPASAVKMPLRIQTTVNGELRQDGTTDMLITPIVRLIEIISSGLTLETGDVIATGTPAGVGVGMKPPRFMKAGDLVEVAVTGLGKLSNRVSDSKPLLSQRSPLRSYNREHTWDGVGLVDIGNGKLVNIRDTGPSQRSLSSTIIFIHGLGASSEYYAPLIQTMDLANRHRVISYDLEGHGLTPTSADSTVTLESFVEDLGKIFSVLNISRATLIGWSLGGLTAMLFAQENPAAVDKLVLLGPGPSPFPEPAIDVFTKRAALVRQQGMATSGIVDAVATAATSPYTQANRPGQLSAVRQYLLATHPEGYAKGCTALAKSVETTVGVGELMREGQEMVVLIVAGRDDKISSVALAEGYVRQMGRRASLQVLEHVGHWHVVEDLEAVVRALDGFI